MSQGSNKNWSCELMREIWDAIGVREVLAATGAEKGSGPLFGRSRFRESGVPPGAPDYPCAN